MKTHGCLTVGEILSHFGQRRANALEKYCEFVQAGIGNPSIWDDLEAQSLLGVEEFAEGLRHLVTEKQQIREIPKGQRFVGRPSLKKLFLQRSLGRASGTGSSPKLLQRTVIAKWRWQASCAPLFDNQPNPRSQRKRKSKDLTPGSTLAETALRLQG